MNSLEYFQKQLDLLIGLIDVTDKNVYGMIKDNKHPSLGIPIEQMFNNNHENYSNLITTSVLILGLSHFEDFLGKCIAVILTKKPEKNDLRITLRVIQDKGQNLVSYLANEQGKRLPFSEKISFIEKNLAGVDTAILNEVKFIYNIRNCIMHNNGLADTTLISKYKENEQISLDPKDVNGYGLLVGQSAKDVWNKLCVLYPPA